MTAISASAARSLALLTSFQMKMCYASLMVSLSYQSIRACVAASAVYIRSASWSK